MEQQFEPEDDMQEDGAEQSLGLSELEGNELARRVEHQLADRQKELMRAGSLQRLINRLR